MGVWIHRTEVNAERTIAAVRCFFGDELTGLTASQFLDTEMVTHFGARPHLIEILNRISGCDFALAWTRRVHVEYDGVPVNVISFEDLKKNKGATGRAKDQADLDHL